MHEQNEFDKILFRQPEGTHMGDCPICFLPMPLIDGKYDSKYFKCCSKTICDGCRFAQYCKNPSKRGENDQCPFCRSPVSDNSILERLKKRVKVDDPIAMMRLGAELLIDGEDYKGAFEYFSKAALLGDIDAHFLLGLMYFEGLGIERDDTKAFHHFGQASICGHPQARYMLAYHEQSKGRMDRAAKHSIISAKLGDEDALKMVKEFYISGFVSKEDFAAALRGHQAFIDATKSEQREQAAFAQALSDLQRPVIYNLM